MNLVPAKFIEKFKVLSLLAVLGLQSCSMPIFSDLSDNSSVVTQCGVHKIKNSRTFIEACKNPIESSTTRGPSLRTDLILNCKEPSGHIYNKTYSWFACLNDVSDISTKPTVTTGSGCLYDTGSRCVINGQIPVLDPSLGSPENYLLHHVASRLETVLQQVLNEGGTYLDQRLKMLDSAQLFADLALEDYKSGNASSGSVNATIALKIIDATSNFVPGVSLVKDTFIIATGINPITGEAVSDVERAMTLGTLMLPSVAAGTVKQFEKVAASLVKVAQAESKSARMAENLVEAIGKSDDEMADLANLAPCLSSNNTKFFRYDFFNLLESTAYAATKCRRLGTITAQIVSDAEKNLEILKSGKTSFGQATRKDYGKTFRQHYSSFDSEIGQVHHAVEQQVLTKYPGVVTEAEINSLQNLRGIPKGETGVVLHQREIRAKWDEFYDQMESLGRTPTKAELLRHAKIVDDLLGSRFVPPIR